MNEWVGPTLIFFVCWSIWTMLKSGSELRTELEVQKFFPTVDLTGWGIGTDFRVPPDFPPKISFPLEEFRPLVREGYLKGWWVGEEYFDDQFLRDKEGVAHVKFLNS